MARKISAGTPTEQDIMGYNNVPVDVAAKFIGWSSCNVCKALIQERAPFGIAVQTGENDKSGRPTYTYNISPGLLIKYKNGELNAWKLNDVIELAADGVEKIINERLSAVAELVTGRSAEERGRRRQSA